MSPSQVSDGLAKDTKISHLCYFFAICVDDSVKKYRQITIGVAESFRLADRRQKILPVDFKIILFNNKVKVIFRTKSGLYSNWLIESGSSLFVAKIDLICEGNSLFSYGDDDFQPFQKTLDISRFLAPEWRCATLAAERHGVSGKLKKTSKIHSDRSILILSEYRMHYALCTMHYALCTMGDVV